MRKEVMISDWWRGRVWMMRYNIGTAQLAESNNYKYEEV